MLAIEELTPGFEQRVTKRPVLVEEKVLDGRSFYLDASREHVVYVRSGVGRDPGEPDSKGMFVREVH